MRSYFSIVVPVWLLLFLSGATTAEEPRAVLDRAIQAHGGAARLERTKMGHLKARSEGHRSDDAFKVEIEEWFDLPNRYSRTVNGSSNGTSKHIEETYTGKEYWYREGSGPAHVTVVRQPHPVLLNWYAILALLLSLRDKDVQLKSLPDETKDGRTIVGFHATSPQGSGNFFFDKSTGLLAKTQQTKSNSLGGQEVAAEAYYDEYRDVQGIHYPMRFKTTGSKTDSMTISLSTIEFGGKIDERMFIKPQMPAAEQPSENDEKTPLPRDRMLIVATVGAGAVVGAVWFLVRASKRGKRETPPS